MHTHSCSPCAPQVSISLCAARFPPHACASVCACMRMRSPASRERGAFLLSTSGCVRWSSRLCRLVVLQAGGTHVAGRRCPIKLAILVIWAYVAEARAGASWQHGLFGSLLWRPCALVCPTVGRIRCSAGVKLYMGCFESLVVGGCRRAALASGELCVPLAPRLHIWFGCGAQAVRPCQPQEGHKQFCGRRM